MSPKSQEEYLLQRIAQGNHHAFWLLWLHYQDYLYRRCQMWMGGNQIDAEEALSQARLKAWEKLPQYASEITNPKAWLTRMTRNHCIDIHRERHKIARNTDSIDEIAINTVNRDVSVSGAPELKILHDEQNIYIRRAIKNLPRRLRDVWQLIYFYQISPVDIAQILRISSNNVYKRIQQGRIILQKQLRNYMAGISNSSAENKYTSVQNQSSTITVCTPKQSSQKHLTYYSLNKNDSSLTENNSSVEQADNSDLSIPALAENSIAFINYQVTALCVDQCSLAL